MGRVNKKKIAEYNESAENGSKKPAAIISNREKEERSYKRAESTISTDNDPLIGHDRHDHEKERSKSTDEAGLKKAGASRKRKLTVAVVATISERNSEESDNTPLNGKKATVSADVGTGAGGKRGRKSTPGKGKTPAKGKSATKASKVTKKNLKDTINDNYNDDDVNDINAIEIDKDYIDEEEEEYEVEKILGHKFVQGVHYYLVRWKGYGKADDTWEPEETLSCPELIEEYRSKKTNNAGNKLKKIDGAGKTGQSGSVRKGGGGGNASADRKSNGRNGSDKKTAVEPDPNKEWEVEKIVDCVDEASGRRYRVRWKGFRPKDDTWEPESNLFCSDLIAKFNKRMDELKNVDTKYLREDPKQTKRLVNETSPRTNFHNRIGRTSKRSMTKSRVFYGEE